jgi:NitT/TauT family transport system ATP-binding protein
MDAVLELLVEDPFRGLADLPQLAEETELTDAELLPVAHALSLLGLAQLESGDLQLTPLGRRYVDGDHSLRQEIFGEQLLAHVPLAAHIRHSLEQEPSGELPETPFLKLLEERLDAGEAERVLQTVISWGRHGEVFDYDFTTGVLRMPTEDEEEAGEAQEPHPPAS